MPLSQAKTGVGLGCLFREAPRGGASSSTDKELLKDIKVADPGPVRSFGILARVERLGTGVFPQRGADPFVDRGRGWGGPTTDTSHSMDCVRVC